MKMPERPPRDDLYRAYGAFAFPSPQAVAERAEDDDDAPGEGVIFGHFAVFDQWTEINSWYEGHFLERIASGAFTKTFQQPARSDMRVMIQHGFDPQIGEKPIAEIIDVRQDDVGAYYEARALDGLDPLVVAGLRAGVYGASFRFRVMREEYVQEPGESEYNPQGLPERTIKEVHVREFGPVTWGAYPTATSGMRSLTDQFTLERLAADPERLERMIAERDERIAADEARLAELAAEADHDAADKTSSAPSDQEREDPAGPERSNEDKQDEEAQGNKPTPRDYLQEGINPPDWFIP